MLSASAFASSINPNLNLEKLLLSSLPQNTTGDFAWLPLPSNNNFSYRFYTNLEGEKILELKNLKSNHAYTLHKSKLTLGHTIPEISPDGHYIVYAIKTQVDNGFIEIVHLLTYNKNSDNIFSDGLVHLSGQNYFAFVKADFTNGINFHYKDLGGKELIRKLENLAFVNTATNFQDEIKAFYGIDTAVDSIEYITPNKAVVVFKKNALANEVVTHELEYQVNHISKCIEYNAKNEILRTIVFTYNNDSNVSEIYDNKKRLAYRAISLGKPMSDILADYYYLRAETLDFYKNQLSSDASIFIEQGKIQVITDIGDKFPLHKLSFARAFNPYSDYGFYFFEESTLDGEAKNLYSFSKGKQQIKKTKLSQ